MAPQLVFAYNHLSRKAPYMVKWTIKGRLLSPFKRQRILPYEARSCSAA